MISFLITNIFLDFFLISTELNVSEVCYLIYFVVRVNLFRVTEAVKLTA